jgi:arabinan endo-1,5-alpha-L-arabinosidase
MTTRLLTVTSVAAILAILSLSPPTGGGQPGSAGGTPEARETLRQMGNRNVGLHDPSTIVRCKDEFWLFATGATVCFRSRDLLTWTPGPRALSAAPAWVRAAVPNHNGRDFWAPDVIRVKDKYLLFISASSFGVNTSAIGVFSNATLDPDDPAYRWNDGGLVIQSRTQDDFNCIDPAAFLDTDGRLWLAFGSFWGGIKLIELNPDTGLRIAPDSPMYALAHWDSIEAPFLYRHDGRYYLFVSIGLCCRGAYSTYETRVGRADKITGPYLDKDGKDMLLGGGSVFLTTRGPYIGPGHPGIIEVDGKSYVSCHFYDGTANGASKLAIRPLTWDAQGWPVAGTAD